MSNVYQKRNCFLCTPSSASITSAHTVKCVVYSYTNDGHVKYAVCIFKKKSRKDFFDKTKFMNTAEKRFKEEYKFFNIENWNNNVSHEKEITLMIKKLIE